MEQKKEIHVPSLVLSIISLAFLLFWAWFISLPCSIIALYQVYKIREFYSTKAAYVMGIIGVSISGLMALGTLIAIATIGATGFGIFSLF